MIQANLLLVLFALNSSLSQAKENDIKRMNDYLVELRSLPRFPAIKGVSVTPSESSAKIPDQIRKLFLRLEKEALGRTGVISLKACDACSGFSTPVNGTIYVGPEFVKSVSLSKSYQDPSSFIAFILAHELGHFIYEYNVLGNKNWRSLNGNRSLAQMKEISTQHERDLESAAHAEVDIYGLLLLKKLGMGFPVDVYKHYEQQGPHMSARIEKLRSAQSQLFPSTRSLAEPPQINR